ncbi:hypothetical protein EXIGLDRAFT_841945 [Exidia glandulosa HHB12029]|uniref:Uncharacterized protein n=1 Tax=Exidia glandulosa HHB12029 TaxID=1314781 RepID=A0A165DKM3_EXIGL|nr:hypothetical protein EXIGLDRAFT_841945 [Exidia glandulosa HHB12029]
MAQSTPTVAARIEFHEDLQRQLEDRATTLRIAREQAHGALLRAERAVSEIDTKLADVDRRARELDETLSAFAATWILASRQLPHTSCLAGTGSSTTSSMRPTFAFPTTYPAFAGAG